MTATSKPSERFNMATEHLTDQYQGWRNYETWAVNLWLTNDQTNYMRLREILEFWADNPQGNAMAAEQILAWVEETNPLSDDCSMFSDILAHVLAFEVDYPEIVKANREE